MFYSVVIGSRAVGKERLFYLLEDSLIHFSLEDIMLKSKKISNIESRLKLLV